MSLPDCPNGRDIVRELNAATEDSAPGMLGTNPDLVRARQEAYDAINSPKSVLDVDMPTWPWSDGPRYCEGSLQKARTQALLSRLGADVAAAREVHEERKKAIGDWFGGLWFWIKVALGVAGLV